MNIKKIVEYWLKGADYNYQTAKFLYEGKRYVDCLFFCHLMLEKILKGLAVAEIKTHAPYIHDLDVLVEKANLELNNKQMENIKVINTFNIRARYDNIKQSFYSQCTKEYAEKYFKIATELYLWLKKQYPKK